MTKRFASSLALYSIAQRWIEERRGLRSYVFPLTGWIGVMTFLGCWPLLILVRSSFSFPKKALVANV